MGASVSVAVRKALVAGIGDLLTAAAEDDVKVSYAWTFGATERERIFTQRPRGRHEPAALGSGRTPRTERLEVDVVVLVESVGGTAEEADERALALGTYVEEYVADNRTLGGAIPGLSWVAMSGFELNNLANDRGHLSEATYTVTYSARLT